MRETRLWISATVVSSPRESEQSLSGSRLRRLANLFFFLTEHGDHGFQLPACFGATGHQFVLASFSRHKRSREKAPGVFSGRASRTGIRLTGR